MSRHMPTRIAARLTKAQRDQLLRGTFGGDGNIRTARALIAKGLMIHKIDSPNGRCGPVVNTPLGDMVAAVLRERGHAG